MLSNEEIKQYARHLSLENVGMAGQEKLKEAKVLVIGAGGLGAPILQYLSAAGVGTIGVVDHDVVDESNLQRQVIFNSEDTGKSKVQVAISRLKQLNPFVDFHAHETKLESSNALELFEKYDIIIDGTDNFATRYLVNDACVIANKPFVHGSIFKFQGQLSVFNYKGGPSYRCLYPDLPKPGETPSCSEVGVLGVLPGVIGTRMAAECLKMILESGKALNGKIEIVDLLDNSTRHLMITRKEENFNLEHLEDDYTFACETNEDEIKETITPLELHKLLGEKEVLLLDVREPFEFDICQFEGSLNIPLNQIPNQIDQIPKDTAIVVVCHHGVRSANAIAYLNAKGWSNLTNLEGGIHAWAVDVDPNMNQY